MRQILYIFLLFMFMLISTVAISEQLISIKWKNNHMTADIKKAVLNDVLNKIEEEKGLLFTIEQSLLNKKISVSFKNLEFSEAIKRILNSFNYAMIYDKHGTIKKVNVVAISDNKNRSNLEDISSQAPIVDSIGVTEDTASQRDRRNEDRPSLSDNRPTPEEWAVMNPGAGEPPQIGPGDGEPPKIDPDHGEPPATNPGIY